MSSRYLVSEMLATIKNCGYSGKDIFTVDYSKLCFDIANLLKDEGYILNCDVVSSGRNNNIKRISLRLKFRNDRNLIRTAKICSKPSCRVFVNVDDLIRMVSRNPFAVIIVSTSKGVMTARAAIDGRHGGELLCIILA